VATEENLKGWPDLRRLTPYVVAFAGTAVVAGLGSSATTLDSWYDGLQKPWFQPPGLVFPLAWTTLYILFTLSIGRAWNRIRNHEAKRALVSLLIVNAILNVLWSVLFFWARRPDLALIEIFPFWLSTLLPLMLLWRHERVSAWLFAPYLAWVSFAALVNFAIVALNPPFGWLPFGFGG
jgi:translocator protein